MDLVNEPQSSLNKISSFTGNYIVLIYKYLTNKYAKKKNFKTDISCSPNSIIKAGWTKGVFWET